MCFLITSIRQSVVDGPWGLLLWTRENNSAHQGHGLATHFKLNQSVPAGLCYSSMYVSFLHMDLLPPSLCCGYSSLPVVCTSALAFFTSTLLHSSFFFFKSQGSLISNSHTSKRGKLYSFFQVSGNVVHSPATWSCYFMPAQLNMH